MKTALPGSEHRVFFLDNLRYFVVLLVVWFHSMAGYSDFSDWWTVNDTNFKPFNSIVLILDLFMMPVLFFIAGYFASHSHQGQTVWQFVKKKLVHLGIPWLMGVIFINPVQMYIWKISQNNLDMDFWQCFLFRLKSAFTSGTSLVTMSENFNQFSHFHFWFLSLLLYFFVMYALLRKGGNVLVKGGDAKRDKGRSTGFSIIFATVCTALLVFFLNMIIYGLFPEIAVAHTWLTMGAVVNIQASRLVLYAASFSLGIYACNKNWFASLNKCGHAVVWLLISAILCFFMHELTFSLINETSAAKKILYVFVHPLCVFSIILALTSAGWLYWNSASKMNRLLAENSYNIYLLHMIFIYLFQLLFLKAIDVPAYMKAVLIFILSSFLSFLISHFALNRSSKISATGIGIVFILMLALI